MTVRWLLAHSLHVHSRLFRLWQLWVLPGKLPHNL